MTLSSSTIKTGRFDDERGELGCGQMLRENPSRGIPCLKTNDGTSSTSSTKTGTFSDGGGP